MLELSLSAVAIFAAYTGYVIVKDDLAAQHTQLNSTPRKAAPPEPPIPKKVKRARATPTPKAPSSRPRTGALKATAAPDPTALAAQAIIAYLAERGPASLKKLSQTLNLEPATIQAASAELVARQAAVATKKGGHPGLAPVA